MTAAIYFSPDGYQSSGPKLMGRHAAGAGFLRAVVAAEPAGTLTGLLSRPAHATSLADQLKSAGFQGRLRPLGFEDHAELKNPGVLYLPGPGLTDFAWRRLAAGGNAYSLCGVTHTTASHGAMESIAQLATAPLFDWDALICTSRSVRDTVRVVVEAQTDYLRWRLGASRVSLPMLPVIPLGVHCADYVFANGRKASARSRFGIDAEDVVVLFLGRLSFHAKAHPQAMYLALDRVAQEFPDRRIHLIQCGWFANVAIDQAFRQGASALCNRVTHHFLDGRDAEVRDDVWAASDIYVSLSDNIQETFGLSPLEAMAAGLPVVVTDWDGYRDTVRDGVDGFRVPTLMPATPAGIDLASRYDAGVDTYDMYCGLTCELVAVDVKATAEALSRLVGDPDLRRRMGEAGRQRVRETFDWSLILKRYRELWSEQNQRRPASADFSLRSFSRPDRLDPFFAFSDYSTWILNGMDRLYLVGTQCGNAAEYANNQLTLRRALAMNSFARAVFPEVEECMRVIDLIASNPGLTVDEVVSAFPRVRQPIIYRGLAWMMKMDVIAFPRTH